MRTKTITIFTAVLLILSAGTNAQLLFKPDVKVQQALQQVICDFPNRLSHITGTLLQENVESSDYTSKVNFPGTDNCLITQYKSKNNKNRSWQAVMPEVENFAAAKKQYRDLFLQVKNLGLQLPGKDKPVKAKGEYDEPSEQKKFAGSIFRVSNEEGAYKDVKVEVALQYTITGWQVSLYVYDKKEDDEILPDSEVKAAN
ncbi:MAG: hypothetical protein U0V75_16710 [Ferruginibacter sp.]